MREFIRRSYPTGLGVTFEVIEKLIADDERAMLAWDKAVRGEHGGAREGAGRKPAVAAATPTLDPETGEIKPDIIRLEKTPGQKPGSDYSTSAQADLRRFEKAARSDDGNAADLLRRVVDSSDVMTVNGACVVMGWRKATVTVIDTPDRMADAAVRRIGPHRGAPGIPLASALS